MIKYVIDVITSERSERSSSLHFSQCLMSNFAIFPETTWHVVVTASPSRGSIKGPFLNLFGGMNLVRVLSGFGVARTLVILMMTNCTGMDSLQCVCICLGVVRTLLFQMN